MKYEFLQFSDLYIKNEYQESLNDLNMIFLEGETHLLWGWDSTPRILANIFRGKGRIIRGSLRINGRKIENWSRESFEKDGIFYVDSQVEFMNSINLAENLFLLKNNSLKKIRLNRKAIMIRTRELLEKYELSLDAGQKVIELRAIEKVLFQLVRLADRKAKMLVLGELSQICSRKDLRLLLEVLGKLKREGISLLIYDSHPEYFRELADEYYLMRGGYLVKKFWEKERFEEYWELAGNPREVRRQQETVFLKPQDTHRCFRWKNCDGKEVSLEVLAGEIVYIRTSGWEQQQEIRKKLLGENGQKTVFESGECRLTYEDGRGLVENKIGFWGEGPLKAEYFSNLSVRDNILLPSVKKISRFGFYQSGEKFVFGDQSFFSELGEIEKSQSLTDKNIIKILCYRWKLFHPKVLILHNILSRADMEMKEWLQKELLEMAGRGTSLILLEAFEEDALPLAGRVEIPNQQWI